MTINDLKEQTKKSIIQTALALNKLAEDAENMDLDKISETNRKLRAKVLVYNSFDNIEALDPDIMTENLENLYTKYDISTDDQVK